MALHEKISRAAIVALLAIAIAAQSAFATVVVPAPDGGIYCAGHPDFGLRDDDVTPESIDSFESLSDRRIAWAYVSFNWDRGIKFPIESCRVLHSRGIVPLVGMMPWSTLKQSQAEKIYTLDKILAGTFDDDLRRCARDVRDSGMHVMIEFGPEANGSWFPWSAAWNGRERGPAKFAATYRHIVNIFRAERADNVTWVFHIASSSAPDLPWNAAKYYYPGDDYVDWIGASVYGRLRNGERAKSFDAIMSKLYPSLAAISPNKPLAILELGVTDDPQYADKPEWIADAFKSVNAGKYPRVRAISWWNKTRRPDGSRSTLEIDSSPESLAAYRAGIRDMAQDAIIAPR